MYLPVSTQSSCARGWAAAAEAVMQHEGPAYNVVIDIDDPTTHDAVDNMAILHVDRFLRERDAYPIITVANTIFPQALYESAGSPDFYFLYHRDLMKFSNRRWGRYFDRMTYHTRADGTAYNPLQDLIDKIRRQKDAGRNYQAAHELAIYDPLLDGRYLRGGQCLSFLSFKLDRNRGLLLTAMYRNHHYVTRCLGNLIGLGRLQAFVAREAGLEVGSLTCISTHAALDTSTQWGVREARSLITSAAAILRGDG